MNLNGRLNNLETLTPKDAFYNNSDNVLVKVFSSSITLSRPQCYCDLERALLESDCRTGYAGAKCDNCAEDFFPVGDKCQGM